MPARTPRSLPFIIIINVLSLLFLVWALHTLSFREVWHDFKHLRWGWVAVGVASNVLAYAVQGWRWSLILAPVAPVKVSQAINAVFVGVYANEVLPLRSGEIIRCYLLARSSELPVSVTLASALIERIFDGLYLIAGIFITLQMTNLDPLIRHSGIILGLIILVGAVLLGIAMYWREQTLDLLLNARWFGWVHVLIKDLHLIGHSRYLYFAFAATLPFTLLQVFPMYAVLRAYDKLDTVPAIAAVCVAIMLRFNAILPQAPGGIGTFPSAVMFGLRPYRAVSGMVRFVYERATRNFGVILLALVTVPLLIAGFIAVALTGKSILAIRRHAQTSMQDRDAVPVEESEESIPPS